jgi:quercetin dioxygenase-like cupin family protein
MRRMLLQYFLLIAGAGLMVVPAVAQEAASAKKPEKVEAALKAAERFDGRATLRAKDGSAKELHVVVRNWAIHPGEEVTRFPERDFTVVQLVAGKVVTVIDGQEKVRTGGEFWTVPAGASMAVKVTSESASFQTITIKQK